MFTTMRAKVITVLAAAAVVGLSGLVGVGVLAQGGPPPPDATPGAVGVGGAVLGGIDPVAAPGYRLEVSETEWAAGAYVTMHTHPTANVVCVQAGALGFSLQQGAASVTRAGDGERPESTEQLALDAEVVLDPRDCVIFDQYAAHTVHTAWNASDGPTRLWAADLYEIGKPFTTFVDERGTPVP